MMSALYIVRCRRSVMILQQHSKHQPETMLPWQGCITLPGTAGLTNINPNLTAHSYECSSAMCAAALSQA